MSLYYAVMCTLDIYFALIYIYIIVELSQSMRTTTERESNVNVCIHVSVCNCMSNKHPRNHVKLHFLVRINLVLTNPSPILLTKTTKQAIALI